MRTRTPLQPGFSLVELVIVVVIIGIIGAIAIPRLSAASERSKAGALQGNLRVLTGAIEHYAAEHNNLTPAEDPVTGPGADGVLFGQRLLGRSDESGALGAAMPWGPYLSSAIPPNPYNGLRTIRIDGAPPGANLAGWQFSTAQRILSGDHIGTALLAPATGDDTVGTATVQGGGG